MRDPPTIADPYLHAAMTHLVGAPAGWSALRSWAHVAPAGWGRAHAEALITAVHAAMGNAGVAAALMPDAAALAGAMAHPDRQDALRRTLDRLAPLSPAVAIPPQIELTRRTFWNVRDAAAVATALRAHGDVVLVLANALRTHDSVFLAPANALADVCLRADERPLPKDAALAGALRALARDDPPIARRLVIALRGRSRRIPMSSGRRSTRANGGGIGDVIAPMSPDGDPPAVSDPITTLASAAVHAPDADLRSAGMTAPAARPEPVRAIWGSSLSVRFLRLPICRSRRRAPPSSADASRDERDHLSRMATLLIAGDRLNEPKVARRDRALIRPPPSAPCMANPPWSHHACGRRCRTGTDHCVRAMRAPPRARRRCALRASPRSS